MSPTVMLNCIISRLYPQGENDAVLFWPPAPWEAFVTGQRASLPHQVGGAGLALRRVWRSPSAQRTILRARGAFRLVVRPQWLAARPASTFSFDKCFARHEYKIVAIPGNQRSAAAAAGPGRVGGSPDSLERGPGPDDGRSRRDRRRSIARKTVAARAAGVPRAFFGRRSRRGARRGVFLPYRSVPPSS